MWSGVVVVVWFAGLELFLLVFEGGDLADDVDSAFAGGWFLVFEVVDLLVDVGDRAGLLGGVGIDGVLFGALGCVGEFVEFLVELLHPLVEDGAGGGVVFAAPGG